MSKFSASPQEVNLVNQIFAQADTQKIGVITGEAAVKVFSGSKLAPSVLAEIWTLADEDNKGVLTRKDVAVAIRLLGHAQRGERVTEAHILRPGPPPSIEGLNAPISGQRTGTPSARSPPPGSAAGLPPLSPQDKAKFTKMFVGYGPTNGLLPGEKARDIFVRSKLPVDKLSQIWALSDTKGRGSLDVTDFTIAMYLIQASMSGTLQNVPQVLPPYVYEQAKPNADGVVAHATGGSNVSTPSALGGFPGRPLSAMPAQYTGQGILQPQATGQRTAPALPSRPSAMPAFPLAPQATGQPAPWDVTTAEKTSSDNFFDSLDTHKKGYIEGDVAVPFLLQSKLSDDVLAKIWDLADLNGDGRLTRDGFAVAMHLIQAKLAGKEVPARLPPTLVPPSMRSNTAVAAPSQPHVSETMRDLLWDDAPTQSAPPRAAAPLIMTPQRTGPISPQHTTPPQPIPPQSNFFGGSADPFGSSASVFGGPFGATQSAHKDLLGDDDEPATTSPPLQDKSAEIGNVQNQLHSTTRALETTKNEREDVERKLADQASQLSALQTQLATAKVSYETETRLLSTLRERFSTQTADIQKTTQELIRAESDLSAIRVEKAEVEGSVLRDKEEVRDLQRKMTEVGMEVETTKLEVEKAKKEAKQQKGLLAIAKKQLVTREAERAKVAKELEEAQAEAAKANQEREEAEAELAKVPDVPASAPERLSSPSGESFTAFAASQPLPASPEIVGAAVGSPSSPKSNNPFERLAIGSGTPRTESPFLPFANSVLPTPPTGERAATPVVPPSDDGAQAADPFGFEAAFGGDGDEHDDAQLLDEPLTATTISTREGSPFGNTPQQLQPPADVTSPVDTESFHTPPSTATIPHAEVPDLKETPAAEPVGSAPGVSQFPGHFPEDTADSSASEGHTDLTSQVNELDLDESDSDSEDNEPLTAVKAKLQEGASAELATSGSTAFSTLNDAFGGSSALTAVPTSYSQQDSLADSTPKAPAAPFVPADKAPKQNGSFDSAVSSAPAGANDFDEAMGLSGSGTSASQFSHVSQFTFDSAFDDDFDFKAAKAATAPQAGSSAASPSATTFPPALSSTTPFPPAPAASGGPSFTTPGPSLPVAPFISGTSFPAAPSTLNKPEANGFDAIFLPRANSVHIPESNTATAFKPASSAVQPLSFDNIFGAEPASDPVVAPNAVVQTVPSNGSHGVSFEDAFGGSTSEASGLDESFSSSTYQHGSHPSAARGTAPFPVSSMPSSPVRENSSSSTSRRSLSPPPRQVSPPPPRSGKSRPGTASSEKEKSTRSSKLSIRLPFGRKKAKHEPLPSHLSQSLLVEEPGSNSTPAADDDIDAVKTLCSMGFSRTQAITALEQQDYDVQRALNTLLGTR